MAAYTLIWEAPAVAGLLRLRARDPAAAKAVRDLVSALQEDPAPPGSSALGEGGLRRFRLDRIRVLYDVDDSRRAVHVLAVGQAAP